MLEIMFFYDGNLSDITETDMEGGVLIDAGDGYTKNMTDFREILMDNKLHIVITNQIELLNNSWLWDTKTHKPKLCLRDLDGTWKPVGRFTKKDLKNGHNLAKMYMQGEFSEKAYRRTAKREPNDLLRFRIS